MATISHLILLVFIFLVTLSLHNTPIVASFGMKMCNRPVNISSICDFTVDPDFCMNALSSDPRVATADSKGLVTISISQAIGRAVSVSNKIPGLYKSAPGSIDKQRLNYCQTNFKIALKYLRVAIIYSKRVPRPTDYKPVENWLDEADGDIIGCINNYHKAGQPKGEFPLKDEAENVTQITAIAGLTIHYCLS